jgi:16S rRNA (uracil1498-N3)-methyltransferase
VQVPAKLRLFLDEAAGEKPLLSQLPNTRTPEDSVALLVGPEGGWTDAERSTITANGWLPCGLGSTILRAETASLAALAIIGAAWQSSFEAKS